MRWNRSVCRSLIAALALFASGGFVRAQSRPADTRTVSTEEGPVVGRVDVDVVSWKGLPYATAPVGELRWRAPRPAPARAAAFEAFAFGPRCPQDDRGLAGPGQGRVGVEDCLQLNVWAPARIADQSLLPVLFWIHGGGMVQGSGTETIYDGAALARAEQVLVVSINYRLGALGFLAHPAFAGSDPDQPAAGNYGLLDQQAALRWVARNIEAFGGDRERILIFGESAGGVSVCAQLASPLARGRFASAIMQSGNCLTQSMPSLDQAQPGLPAAYDQGRRFASAAGCADPVDPAACLRALSVEQVLDTLPGEVGLLNPNAETYGPIVDGHVLLESPGEALRAGRSAAVPFIAGTTADEATVFVPAAELSYAQFTALVRTSFRQHADAILEAYPASDYPDGRAALSALTTDLSFTCPTRRSLRDHAAWGRPAWLYHFTRVPAYAAATALGAHHGVEIGYLFDSYGPLIRRGMTDVDRAISARMQADWANLAREGRPAPGREPAWPQLDTDGSPGLDLGDVVAPIEGWRAERCDVWDAVAGWTPLAPVGPPAGAGEPVAIYLPLVARGAQRPGSDGPLQAATPSAPTPTATTDPTRPSPTATQVAAPAFVVRRNLRYLEVEGQDPDLTSLDVYAPSGASGAPVMVYLHGGGWAAGDKAAVGVKPEAFVGRGWVFVSANYRLTPEVDFPVHAEDVARALAFVVNGVAALGGDPERLFVMGHSAGAHLAALVATDPRYLGAVGLSPAALRGVVPLDTQAYDIRRLAELSPGGLSAVYTATFGKDPATWAMASPGSYVMPGSGIPPMCVAYSGGATPVESPRRRQLAEDFVARLREAGIPAQIVPSPSQTHAQINQAFGRPGDPVTEAVMAFLAERLSALVSGE